MVHITTPRFPPELTDMVIDYLDGESETLSKTSLVCKSWLFRSRVHLFSSITVTRDFSSFAAFLRVNPHIRPYVHGLVLQGRQCDYSDTSCSPTPVVTLEPSTLAVILSYLPHLRSLQFHDVSFHGEYPPPGSTSFKINELVMMNVGSSQDTTNDLLHILGLFSDIRSLHISSVEQMVDDEETQLKSDALHVPYFLRVRSLKLEDVPNDIYLRVLRQTESVNTLRAIDAECVGVEDIEALAELLQDANSRVEELAINMSQCFNTNVYAGQDSDEIDVLDSRAICETLGSGVSACTNLTSLDVAVSLDACAEGFDTYHDAWHCLSGILHSTPSASVRHIGIELSSEECFAPLQELDLNWQPLRDVLKKFSNVEKLTFSNTPGTAWWFSQQEKEIVRLNLPGLHKRGLLQVGC